MVEPHWLQLATELPGWPRGLNVHRARRPADRSYTEPSLRLMPREQPGHYDVALDRCISSTPSCLATHGLPEALLMGLRMV